MVIYPKNVSLKSFLLSCDLLITGRGNIGIEAAGLGTNVVVAGNNYYQKLGLVFEPGTKSEYFKYIKKIKFNKLNLNQINKSNKQHQNKTKLVCFTFSISIARCIL